MIGFRNGAEAATSRTSSSILVKRWSGNWSLKVRDEEIWYPRKCLIRAAVATVATIPSAIEKHKIVRSTFDRLSFITTKSGAVAQTKSASRLTPICGLAEGNYIRISFYSPVYMYPVVHKTLEGIHCASGIISHNARIGRQEHSSRISLPSSITAWITITDTRDIFQVREVPNRMSKAGIDIRASADAIWPTTATGKAYRVIFLSSSTDR